MIVAFSVILVIAAASEPVIDRPDLPFFQLYSWAVLSLATVAVTFAIVVRKDKYLLRSGIRILCASHITLVFRIATTGVTILGATLFMVVMAKI